MKSRDALGGGRTQTSSRGHFPVPCCGLPMAGEQSHREEVSLCNLRWQPLSWPADFQRSPMCAMGTRGVAKSIFPIKKSVWFSQVQTASQGLSVQIYFILEGEEARLKKPLKPIWGCKISLKKFLMFWRISIFSCTGVQHGSLQFLLKLNLNACWAVHVRHQGLFFHMFSCPFWVSVVPGLWRAGGTGGLFCWNAVLCFKAVFIRDKNSTTDIIRLSNIRPKY